MGACLCTPQGTEAERQINKQINSHMKSEIAAKETEHRILLLGPGDSGKTTVLKQMRRIHDGTIPPDAIDSFVAYIKSKSIHYMKILCEKSIELAIPLQSAENDDIEKVEQSRDFICNLSVPFQINYEIAEHIKLLWQNSGIQETWRQREKFQIPDNVPYFFDQRLDDIVQEQYIPTFEDYLRVRMRTTGINQEAFSTSFGADGHLIRNTSSNSSKNSVISVTNTASTNSNNTPQASAYKDLEIENARERQLESMQNMHQPSKSKNGVEHKFIFMDVGGQRAERKKWINMLTDNVDAVVYLVAVSEYDMVCFEDSTTLRMTEAWNLFEEVLSKGFMKGKTVTLFFNKYDLLLEKLADENRKTIRDYYPDYPANLDPRNPENVCDYIYEKFLSIYNKIEKDATSIPHYHTTSALNTDQIDNLMGDMQKDLIKQQLEMAGF